MYSKYKHERIKDTYPDAIQCSVTESYVCRDSSHCLKLEDSKARRGWTPAVRIVASLKTFEKEKQ